MHTAQNFGPKVNQTYTLEEEHHVVHKYYKTGKSLNFSYLCQDLIAMNFLKRIYKDQN